MSHNLIPACVISRWSVSLTLLLACLVAAPLAGADQPRVITELAIEPDTFYELTFKAARGSGGAGGGWMIHMRTAQGELPYDGVLADSWQRLVDGQVNYAHAFLSPRSAATLQFLVSAHNQRRITDIQLTRIDPPHHILDGDLTRARKGMSDYSGWPQRYRSQWVEHEDGVAMRVNTNGYVLGAYFPVIGGAGYRYVRGSHSWPGVSLLAYDVNKRLIGRVGNNFRENPPIRMPQQAAYARLILNTGHDHIPSHAVVHFTGAGLELLTDESPQRPAAPMPDTAFGEIVLHPGADGREERAAKELQHWLEKITGTTLPLLAEPSGKQRLRLHVGSHWAQGYGADLAELAGSDGYAVRRNGDDIYIFGPSSRGTLYGVYAFLERNTDIIWPRPNPEFEAVYSVQRKLELKDTDFRSRPSFWGRHISNRYSGPSSYIFQDWMARNGLNSPHRLHQGLDYLDWQRGAMIGYGGSFISWARPGEGDEDLYPLVDGQRDVSRWRQPCYTHPDLVDRMVETVRQRFGTLDQPGIDAEYLHMTLADNWTVCACDRCMTPIDLPDGTRLAPTSAYANQDPRFFSTRTFIMLNAVAERLSQDYPNLKLQTHAYIFTAEPPAVDLHPAIVPQYAAYPTQNVRYPIMAGQGQDISIYDKDIWRRRFTQWRDKDTRQLGYFGYYYVAGFNALADTAAADYRDLLAFGGIQAHTEGFPVDESELSTWDYDSMEKWVIARLMWDPHQDPAKLREHYMRRVYREAAPVMAQFYQLIRDAWHNAPEDVFFNCHTNAQVIFEKLIVEPGLESQLRGLLVQAQQAAVHPISREMIVRKLAQFDDLKARFGQQDVPYVEESTHDWADATSPHWEKALVLSDFKLVDDWRTFDQQPAEQQTLMALMHDGSHLYIRITGYDTDLGHVVVPAESGVGVFPQGDRGELVLRTQEKHRYFLAAGPNGAFFAQPGIDARVATATDPHAWIVMLAIPLESIQWSADSPMIEARAGRVYRHDPDIRRESSLTGVSLFNLANQFWTKLNIGR